MIEEIGESQAWRLLRGLDRVGPGEPRHVATLDDRPEVLVEVDPRGRWQASRPTTPEARDLLDLFVPLRAATRVAVGQLGQSLDGFIATSAGHSHYVTGPEDIRRLHRLRALVDAVVVGAGTVAADDPLLTVRDVEGPSPARVILDPRGRLTGNRRVFLDRSAPTLVVGEGQGSCGYAERCGLPTRPDGTFDPHRVLEMLATRGMHRVLVEGGGVTVSRFLQSGALDRLHVTVAPLLIGGGRPALSLRPAVTMDDALRPVARIFRLGQDVLFDLDLRAPVPR